MPAHAKPAPPALPAGFNPPIALPERPADAPEGDLRAVADQPLARGPHMAEPAAVPRGRWRQPPKAPDMPRQWDPVD
jgi:hypothetical protein